MKIFTRYTITLIGITVLSISASAQAPAKVRSNIACDNAVGETGFTGCEVLKLEALSGKMAPLQEKMQEITSEASTFIQRVVAENPGKSYQPPSQQFPYGHLIDTPKPQPKPTAPSPATVHPATTPTTPAAVAPAPAVPTPIKK